MPRKSVAVLSGAARSRRERNIRQPPRAFLFQQAAREDFSASARCMVGTADPRQTQRRFLPGGLSSAAIARKGLACYNARGYAL